MKYSWCRIEKHESPGKTVCFSSSDLSWNSPIILHSRALYLSNSLTFHMWICFMALIWEKFARWKRKKTFKFHELTVITFCIFFCTLWWLVHKKKCFYIHYYILRFIVEMEIFSVCVRLLPRESEQHKMAFTSLLNLLPETN